MSIEKIFIREKNNIRKDFYKDFKDFLEPSKPFKVSEIGLYSGYFSIHKSSMLYLDVCIENGIDITDSISMAKFLISDNGVKEASRLYSKMYISPVRKYLKKYKVFDGSLFIKIVKYKASHSKDEYVKLCKTMGKPRLSALLAYG